ncbi:MAG: LamG domain-containing protein [Planctomycetes bacterium]|nr:LamG domain-containing protein [Planctomycetota bacterium]
MAIVGVISTSMAGALAMGVRVWRDHNGRGDLLQNLRVALSRIEREGRYGTAVNAANTTLLELTTTYLLDTGSGTEKVKYAISGSTLQRSTDTGGGYGTAQDLAQGVTAFRATYESQTDDFNDDAIDTAKWTKTDSGSNVVESLSTMRVTGNGSSEANGIRSAGTFRRSGLVVEATYTPGGAGTSDTALTVDANTVMLLRLDETGGTSADDASANNRDGPLQNMLGTEWTAGKFGNGLSFDGTNDHLQISDDAVLDPASFTIEAWVKFDTVGSGSVQGIAGKRSGSDDGFELTLESSRKFQFRVDTGAGNGSTALGSTQVSAGTWTHVAATYDGTTMRLYVNGTQEASAARMGDWTNGESLTLGSLQGAAYLDGMLDDVRFSNTARTSFPNVGAGGGGAAGTAYALQYGTWDASDTGYAVEFRSDNTVRFFYNLGGISQQATDSLAAWTAGTAYKVKMRLGTAGVLVYLDSGVGYAQIHSHAGGTFDDGTVSWQTVTDGALGVWDDVTIASEVVQVSLTVSDGTRSVSGTTAVRLR